MSSHFFTLRSFHSRIVFLSIFIFSYMFLSKALELSLYIFCTFVIKSLNIFYIFVIWIVLIFLILISLYCFIRSNFLNFVHFSTLPMSVLDFEIDSYLTWNLCFPTKCLFTWSKTCTYFRSGKQKVHSLSAMQGGGAGSKVYLWNW